MSLSRLIKEVHELAANLMLVLAVVHVAGVAVESMALKRNLVRPMIRGGS
jgi:cytochrome b